MYWKQQGAWEICSNSLKIFSGPCENFKIIKRKCNCAKQQDDLAISPFRNSKLFPNGPQNPSNGILDVKSSQILIQEIIYILVRKSIKYHSWPQEKGNINLVNTFLLQWTIDQVFNKVLARVDFFSMHINWLLISQELV